MTDTHGRRGSTLGRRLLVRYALTIVAVLAVLAVVLDRTIESVFLDDLTDSLVAEARTLRATLPDDPGTLQSSVESLGRQIEARITIIRTDGVVIADSTGDPTTFENHRGRPEVDAALAGRIGVASRVSESVGEPYRYVALPPQDDVVTRLALPLSVVATRLARVRSVVIGGTVVAALLGVGAVWLVARSVARPLREMIAGVSAMRGGDLRARLPVEGAAELVLLARTLNGMAEDLAARIEEARRERQALETILGAMEEGVILLERDDRVGYSNPSARRILGGQPESLRALAPHPLQRLVMETQEGGGSAQLEVDIGLPARSVRATAIPIAQRGEVLLVLRDVTGARRVEAIRRDFVADASHELKTPAASIQASAETLERALADDPDAAARFAARLRHDAARLSRIVSDLLDLSRLESERPALQPVRLDRLVTEEVGRLGSDAKEAGLTMSVEASPVTVPGSAKDLGLLTRNLLDNAIRYTASGGRVRVHVTARDGQAELTVHDTGIGIPTRDLPRIFERFYRVDRARSRETGGTGLGLSIARHVVEQHGGRIHAESELGRGSTFRVTLPTDAQRDVPSR